MTETEGREKIWFVLGLELKEQGRERKAGQSRERERERETKTGEPKQKWVSALKKLSLKV